MAKAMEVWPANRIAIWILIIIAIACTSKNLDNENVSKRIKICICIMQIICLEFFCIVGHCSLFFF